MIVLYDSMMNLVQRIHHITLAFKGSIYLFDHTSGYRIRGQSWDVTVKTAADLFCSFAC